MIEFKNVSKSYEEAQVVKELSFCVNSGEFFVIVGPSGSGKTTLLKMINKLIEPTSGNVYFDGVDLEDMDLKECSGIRCAVRSSMWICSSCIAVRR